jgi:hypothetical protein
MTTALAVAVLAGAMALLPPVPVDAQEQAPAPAAQPSAPAPESKLPVSLDRIRRQLRQQSTVETERFEDFRLLTSLNVYGQSPRFELFSPDDRRGIPGSAGPIRYGGMTHQEFLQQVTPRNFQAPVMNLSGAAFSLGNWISEKRREAQRRKEAEARQDKK